MGGEDREDIGLIEADQGVISVHEGPYKKYLRARNIQRQQETLAKGTVSPEGRETGTDIIEMLKGELSKNFKI